MTCEENCPYQLEDPEEKAIRQVYLNLPHMAPLKAYAEVIRQERGRRVPDFNSYDEIIKPKRCSCWNRPAQGGSHDSVKFTYFFLIKFEIKKNSW